MKAALPAPLHQSIPPEVSQRFSFCWGELRTTMISTTLPAGEEGWASQLGEHRAGSWGPRGLGLRLTNTKTAWSLLLEARP